MAFKFCPSLMRGVLLALTLPLSSLALASSHPHYSYHHSYHYRSYTNHSHSSHYYTNVSGHRVHRPVFSAHAPRGWMARCADGLYSFSEHHSGTCSHHGGVLHWH